MEQKTKETYTGGRTRKGKGEGKIGTGNDGEERKLRVSPPSNRETVSSPTCRRA